MRSAERWAERWAIVMQLLAVEVHLAEMAGWTVEAGKQAAFTVAAAIRKQAAEISMQTAKRRLAMVCRMVTAYSKAAGAEAKRQRLSRACRRNNQPARCERCLGQQARLALRRHTEPTAGLAATIREQAAETGMRSAERRAIV